MKSKITRRQLAGVAAGSIITAAAVSAQQPAASGTNAELEKARASHQQNSATLAKFDIPQATEPAFVFRA
jgi:hypothetical protein